MEQQAEGSPSPTVSPGYQEGLVTPSSLTNDLGSTNPDCRGARDVIGLSGSRMAGIMARLWSSLAVREILRLPVPQVVTGMVRGIPSGLGNLAL